MIVAERIVASKAVCARNMLHQIDFASSLNGTYRLEQSIYMYYSGSAKLNENSWLNKMEKFLKALTLTVATAVIVLCSFQNLQANKFSGENF